MHLRKFVLLMPVFAFVSVAAVCSAASSEDAASGSRVVAIVDGQKITASQIDQSDSNNLLKARAQILKAKYQYYLAERKALEKTLDDKALADEARKEHLTVEQLLDKHVKSKVKDPSEEAMHVYYLGVQTDDSYQTARPNILKSIRMFEEQNLQKEYIKSLREKQNAEISLVPPREDIGLGAAPTSGPSAAPVTVVEFADYQCPYCRGVEPSMKKLREQYKDKIIYSYRDFPLPMHPFAEKAAEADRCAGEQGKYWQYHDLLFQAQADGLAVPALKSMAKQVSLDTAKFDSCLDSGKEEAAVKKDLDQGKSIGITGTPTIFVNGYLLSGAASYATISGLVDQQLAAAKAGKSSKLSSSRSSVAPGTLRISPRDASASPASSGAGNPG